MEGLLAELKSNDNSDGNLKAATDSLEESIKILDDKTAEFDGKLKEAREMCHEQVGKKQEVLELLKEQLDDVVEEKAEFESVIKELKERIDGLEYEVADMGDISDENDDLKKEIKVLNKAIKSVESNIFYLETYFRIR